MARKIICGNCLAVLNKDGKCEWCKTEKVKS